MFLPQLVPDRYMQSPHPTHARSKYHESLNTSGDFKLWSVLHVMIRKASPTVPISVLATHKIHQHPNSLTKMTIQPILIEKESQNSFSQPLPRHHIPPSLALSHPSTSIATTTIRHPSKDGARGVASRGYCPCYIWKKKKKNLLLLSKKDIYHQII